MEPSNGNGRYRPRYARCSTVAQRSANNRTPGNNSQHPVPDASSKDKHALIACARCRMKKVKCDPTIPKCNHCSRAGETCEYWCQTKREYVPRSYVVNLEQYAATLRRELAQIPAVYRSREYDNTKPELDNDQDATTENAIRQGGLVSQVADDETPRFLGPSSGIAMTRLVIEEARRYTNSRSIRELIPDINERRSHPPEGSIPPAQPMYPMTSAFPADGLPTPGARQILLNVFNQKAQYMFPTIHEGQLETLVDEVYQGDLDAYKNYIVRMVLAISIQKMDPEYSGLADSYYLAAMTYIEEVIRPMSVYTIQCLILIAQYSLLTPTRAPIYHIIGLATRICFALDLASESTIMYGTDPKNALEQDMRRRMVWCVFNMELALAHSLGRPSGFAIKEDSFGVKFFSLVDDRHITTTGITSNKSCEKKIMCEHFFHMRLLQAEIRRVLYQTKRPQPQTDEDEWFVTMQDKVDKWFTSSPAQPAWSQSWFRTKYNTIIVFLYRPSPQIPQPTARAASLCYTACAENIRSQVVHLKSPSFDKTWVFLQSIYMAVNTILWSISYPSIRASFPREEVAELIDIALTIIRCCAERWPGADPAADLYERLTSALLQSYEMSPNPYSHSYNAESTPPALNESSPHSSQSGMNTFSPAEVSPIQNQPTRICRPSLSSANGYIGESNESLVSAQIPLPKFRADSFWNDSHAHHLSGMNLYNPAFHEQYPSMLQNGPDALAIGSGSFELSTAAVLPPMSSDTILLSCYTDPGNYNPHQQELDQDQFRERFDQFHSNGMQGVEKSLGIVNEQALHRMP